MEWVGPKIDWSPQFHRLHGTTASTADSNPEKLNEMEAREILFLVIAFPIVAGCLLLLWGMIRFGIISSHKTKGSRTRLRSPDAKGVASLCGFLPEEELVHFFRTFDGIERFEFYFVDQRTKPSKGWFIGHFLPISPSDTKEWLKITKVPGLPIAINGDGGTYYLSSSGALYLSDPRKQDDHLLVAESVADFTQFSLMEVPADSA